MGKRRQIDSQKLGERTLKAFELRGVPTIRSRDPLPDKPPYAICQAKYITCYGVEGKIDAKVNLGDGRIINIECKYQDGSGSTDEKLPYVFKNFECAMQCTEFILLYDGPWWEQPRGKAAIDWAKREAEMLSHRLHKTARVLNFDGFMNWLKTISFEDIVPTKKPQRIKQPSLILPSQQGG